MKLLKAVAVATATFTASIATAQAAPLWIERQFIPTPELVAPVFAEHAQTKAANVDHTAFDRFLERYLVVTPGYVSRVRYSEVTSDDREALNAYIKSLEAQDVTQLTQTQQKAFWTNLYNSTTIRLILDNYPTASIRDIKTDGKGPWDAPLVKVNDVDLTLSQIENHVLRALFDEPRIHYALNCASVGCPNLATKAYTADNWEAMLKDAAISYVNDPRGVAFEKGRLIISKIYGWYREDFGADKADVLAHLRTYASDDLKAQLETVKKISKHRYDWALNDAAVNGS